MERKLGDKLTGIEALTYLSLVTGHNCVRQFYGDMIYRIDANLGLVWWCDNRGWVGSQNSVREMLQMDFTVCADPSIKKVDKSEYDKDLEVITGIHDSLVCDGCKKVAMFVHKHFVRKDLP